MSKREMFWKASICKKGHIVELDIRNDDEFCSQCGSDAIKECLYCSSNIRGPRKVISMAIGDAVSYKLPDIKHMTFPYYCSDCGHAFIWTEKILKNAVTLLSLDEDVDDRFKELIKNAIPDLLVEGIDTPVATAQFKIAFGKFTKPVKDSLYQLLVDVISETMRKALFPDT